MVMGAIKENKLPLAIMGTKILRTSGITRHDYIRNENIRDQNVVAPMVGKLSEGRLQWYRHVIRAAEKARLVRTLESMGNDQNVNR